VLVTSNDRGQKEATLVRTTEALRGVLAKPLAPGLYLVATPIGNLGDMTLRAVATLSAADVIYCEDTRHSRTLASHFGFSAPLKAYHEHNGDAARPQILEALAEGRRIVLISDAGTPLISDPGYKLVRAVINAGHMVTSLPGPSAVVTALTLSGLPTDCFLFAGFLPPKSAARIERLMALSQVPATLVFYEAPSRAAACVADIATVLGDRDVAVARELTKLHETILRGTAEAVAAKLLVEAPPGEFVVMVGPPKTAIVTDAMIEAHLETAMAETSTRDAAQAVSEALGVARGRVYDLALALKRRKDSL
jgi:16S rRNA (cytidine1402-2'-O)-methyltransferase